jgi:hypothetical protein
MATLSIWINKPSYFSVNCRFEGVLISRTNEVSFLWKHGISTLCLYPGHTYGQRHAIIMFTSCYFSDANVSYFVAATVPHVEFLECLTREQFFRFFLWHLLSTLFLRLLTLTDWFETMKNQASSWVSACAWLNLQYTQHGWGLEDVFY